MATSGAVNTNSYNDAYLRLEWNRTSYDSASGINYVHWILKGVKSSSGYYYARNFKVTSYNFVTGSTTELYNSSSDIQLYNGTIIAEGNDYFTTNPDGTCRIQFNIEGAIYTYAVNCTGYDYWDLDRVPRQANLNSAPNFNDEQNPTITYSNPAGNSVDSLQACISLTGSSADVPYRNISKTGSSYTFNLTTAERNTLRNATSGNSRNVTFYVRTVISGTTFYSTLQRTFTIVNGNPTFSSFEYRDTGEISTQLTGDNQIIINDFNVVKVKIPVADKAIANKGATMVKYRAVCGNITDEKNYSSNTDVELTLSYIKSRTITVYAIDSRGNSKTVSITIDAFNWKNYVNATMDSAIINRENGVGTTTILKFSGKIWKTNDEYDFGAVENSITECTYKYKKTNESEFENEISITPTVDNEGNYSFNSTILGDLGANGFSLDNSYNVQIVLQDATTRQVVYNLLLGTGSPAIAIHRNGVAIGAPYNTNESGPLQVYGKSINTYSTNEIRIGTWITGKPIYRKVINIGNLPNDDYKNVAHNISNLSFVTKLYLAVTTGTSFYQANMTGTSVIYSGGTVVIRATDTNIQVGTTTNYSGHSGYAIIEYTKTTD